MLRFSLFLMMLAAVAATAGCFEDHEPQAGFRASVSAEVECRTVTSTLGTRHLLVRAALAGQDPGWFLLESATSYIIVDSRRVNLAGGLEIGTGQFPRPCRIPVTFYEVEHLDVGPMRLRHATVGTADLTAIETVLGEPLLGILGAGIFLRSVVEVDYLANDGQGRVAIHDPGHYVLERGEWMPVGLSRFEIIVPGTFERAVKGSFVIDTGYPGGLAVFSAFAVNKRLLEGREFTGRSVPTVCGESTERRTRIDKFTFGGHTFEDPVVSFLEPGSATDVNSGRLGGVIGRDFLKEFVLVTDLPNNRIAFVDRGDSAQAARSE